MLLLGNMIWVIWSQESKPSPLKASSYTHISPERNQWTMTLLFWRWLAPSILVNIAGSLWMIPCSPKFLFHSIFPRVYVMPNISGLIWNRDLGWRVPYLKPFLLVPSDSGLCRVREVFLCLNKWPLEMPGSDITTLGLGEIAWMPIGWVASGILSSMPYLLFFLFFFQASLWGPCVFQSQGNDSRLDWFVKLQAGAAWLKVRTSVPLPLIRC